jgi:hypothetical protein
MSWDTHVGVATSACRINFSYIYIYLFHQIKKFVPSHHIFCSTRSEFLFHMIYIFIHQIKNICLTLSDLLFYSIWLLIPRDNYISSAGLKHLYPRDKIHIDLIYSINLKYLFQGMKFIVPHSILEIYDKNFTIYDKVWPSYIK